MLSVTSPSHAQQMMKQIMPKESLSKSSVCQNLRVKLLQSLTRVFGWNANNNKPCQIEEEIEGGDIKVTFKNYIFNQMAFTTHDAIIDIL